MNKVIEIVGLSLPFQRGNLQLRPVTFAKWSSQHWPYSKYSSSFQWFANICTKLSRAWFRKRLCGAHGLNAKTRTDPPLTAQLYVFIPQHHSSTFKALLTSNHPWKKHPTNSRHLLRFHVAHPPLPRAALPAFSVAPNGGTAPSVTGLSQFILEDYQLSAADSSTGARLSTHLLLRGAPLPVIIEGDTVPPWLSSYIAFTIPPPRPQFPPLVPPPVRRRVPYRYPKTRSPGQEDPTLANNLEKCILSL